eukprot:60983-Prorocentrum_minimum.AAC.7
MHRLSSLAIAHSFLLVVCHTVSGEMRASPCVPPFDVPVVQIRSSAMCLRSGERKTHQSEDY